MLNVFKKIDFFLEERSFVSGVSLAHAMAAGICGTAADAQRLVGWSLTALSTQCRSYRAFKVRLY